MSKSHKLDSHSAPVLHSGSISQYPKSPHTGFPLTPAMHVLACVPGFWHIPKSNVHNLVFSLPIMHTQTFSVHASPLPQSSFDVHSTSGSLSGTIVSMHTPSMHDLSSLQSSLDTHSG